MASDPSGSDPSPGETTPSTSAPRERVVRRVWPAIGDFNVLEAFVGQRGMGKSTLQAARAWELQQATGAYVIGHSLGRRMPERLPAELGGHRLPIVYHASLKALAKGVGRDPSKWHVLAPPLPQEGGPRDPDTADDLMAWSVMLSKSVRDSAWARAHPGRALLGVPKSVRYTGLPAPPIIVILDEGIAVDAASTGDSATGKNKWFLQYVYSVRHYHVGLLYAIQEPTSRSWRVLESATAIYCFRLRHQWAVNAMQAAGFPPEEVARLPTLPRFRYIVLEDIEHDRA
jgi:hypothetical protein